MSRSNHQHAKLFRNQKCSTPVIKTDDGELVERKRKTKPFGATPGQSEYLDVKPKDSKEFVVVRHSVTNKNKARQEGKNIINKQLNEQED